ncbi:MAG: hypothetical protein PHV21_06480 [Synergistaceae bacterium]|nr:hypothetical protein [Synergistaceae bacterium]
MNGPATACLAHGRSAQGYVLEQPRGQFKSMVDSILAGRTPNKRVLRRPL